MNCHCSLYWTLPRDRICEVDSDEQTRATDEEVGKGMSPRQGWLKGATPLAAPAGDDDHGSAMPAKRAVTSPVLRRSTSGLGREGSLSGGSLSPREALAAQVLATANGRSSSIDHVSAERAQRAASLQRNASGGQDRRAGSLESVNRFFALETSLPAAGQR